MTCVDCKYYSRNSLCRKGCINKFYDVLVDNCPDYEKDCLEEQKMNNVWIIHGIYYEEDHYECRAVESVHRSLPGATKKLVQLQGERPYEEYEIKKYYLGE